MVRAWALVLVFCCYCSYSLADGGYTQQYQVGDAGPNSGTITAVTVNSVLSDTQTELIGGFQETTETWNHTETLTEVRTDQVITTELVEVVTSVTREVVTEVQTPVTTTTTSETYTSTTTNNLAPDINAQNYDTQNRVRLQGQGNCNYGGAIAAGEACFGAATQRGTFQGGGTITSDRFDIDTGLTQAELNRGIDLDYGAKVQSHSSNTSVPLCQNTNNDCKDLFRMTVNIYSGTSTTALASYSHEVILDYNGTQEHSWKTSIGSNNYGLGLEAELVMFGVDAGYTGGYYGPIVSDPWLTVTYDVIGYITETITTYVTEQVISYVTEQVITYEEVTNIELVDRTFTTELTDTTTVFTSEYIGDPIVDIPVEEVDVGEEFTVEIEDVNGDVIAEFTVEVVEVDAGVVEVQIESTDSSTGMVEIETVAVVETIQEIETLDTGMDSSMDTGSVMEMEISVDSVDSVSDLADVVEIEVDAGSTDTVEVEVEVAEVETTVESTSEVNTSSTIEETSTNDANEAGADQGTTETSEGGAETEGTEAESNGDAGTDESTSDSGDSGNEEQESSDVQENESESSETEEVQESSSDVEESVGDSESNSDEGEGSDDGNDNKESSDKSGSKTKTKVKTKVSKSPKEVKKATKAAITKKILQQISIAANQSFAAGENLRLVLLATQGDTETFKEYQLKLPQQNTVWYNDQGIYQDVPQIKDPYGVLFSLAQDKKHEEMVEEQYRD